MPQPQPWRPPAPPDAPVKEGARWRWHRPSSEQVAEWFGTQPMDDGMLHEHYVGGVVLIPQSEKVKYTRPDGSGMTERYEQVFTPYVQIGTRDAYFHRLAESRGLIPVIEPVKVPRTTNAASPYFNANMTEGLWWHVVQGEQGGMVKYLCATWRVAMYTPESYMDKLRGRDPLPMRQGEGTKQVYGGADVNQLAKAATGAIGRALGVAGILVVGTGIATAEDMMELNEQRTIEAPPVLPGGVPSEIAPGEPPELPPAEALNQLRSRALALQVQMQENTPAAWRDFVAWWNERKQQEGWGTLNDVPLESLKGVYQRMVVLHDAGAQAEAQRAAAEDANDATEGGA